MSTTKENCTFYPRIKEYQLAFRAMGLNLDEATTYRLMRTVVYMLDTAKPDLMGIVALESNVNQILNPTKQTTSK
jgi:hypothetical protein